MLKHPLAFYFLDMCYSLSLSLSILVSLLTVSPPFTGSNLLAIKIFQGKTPWAASIKKILLKC